VESSRSCGHVFLAEETVVSSYRKKYASTLESPRKDDEAPVTAAPTQAAAPPPAVEPKQEEPAPAIETKSPAEAAGAAEIRKRIAEMERAEALFRQGAQQPPPQTRAEQPQPPEMPVHVRE